MLSTKALAGIQYAGIDGVSQPCKEVVMDLIQCGRRISVARILTFDREHCLLLTVDDHDLVAVKSGFSSGYIGEGPSAFSYVLILLYAHRVDIEEFEVEHDLLERVGRSCLTVSDLDELKTAKPVRPSRWNDYVSDRDWKRYEDRTLWASFHPIVPFAMVDPRIIELALRFREAPDDCLLTGYRRLEDIVRERTGEDEYGQKLFANAFLGDDAKLTWKGMGGSERSGRANLFTGAYMAFRNRRAHRESKDHGAEMLDEFLLLNHLFKLEGQAVTRSAEDFIKK